VSYVPDRPSMPDRADYQSDHEYTQALVTFGEDEANWLTKYDLCHHKYDCDCDTIQAELDGQD